MKHEAQVAEEDNRQLSGILNFVSYFVGTIMALAATVARELPRTPSSTDVAASSRPCARSGFDSVAIVASMLLESIVLALPARCSACWSRGCYSMDFSQVRSGRASGSP